MKTFLGIMFCITAAISFLGMVGEDGKPQQKYYAASFTVSAVAATATIIF